MNTEVQKISVDDIIPNRFQPRKNFDEESLKELADSIRQHGIIQPLVLRKLGDKYEIIAGERRYKAANIVGLKTVPAIAMEIDDASSAEIALVENVQRKDLTAIEEAKSYQKILELGQMNQDELAKRVGKKQSTVSNKLRLLNLSEEAQQALLDNKISERHARSLLRIKNKDEQNNMLNKIIENRMTVRETDLEIKNLLGENNIPAEEYEILDFQLDMAPDIPANTQTHEIEHKTPENENPVYINPLFAPEQQVENNVANNDNISVSPLPSIEPQIPNQNIPEFDQVGIIGQDINPSIQNPGVYTQQQAPGPFSGKFFNLDDEAANMNVGIPFATNQNNNFEPTQFGPVPTYNEPTQNSSNENFGFNPIADEPISPRPIMEQQDITGAVAILRNTVMNLQNNGYMIDINEDDSETAHQIIINIQK